MRSSAMFAVPSRSRPAAPTRLRLFVGLVLVLSCSRVSLAEPPAVQSSDGEFPAALADWTKFRARFPYHIQTACVGSRREGRRTLILSEPPPQAKLQDIVARSRASSWRVFQHTIGHDGWVRDVVLDVAVDHGGLPVGLASLLRLAYGSAYKAEALDLDRLQAQVQIPEVSVSASDLTHWLLDEKAALTSAADGSKHQLTGILARPIVGVFQSEARGLVVWTLPLEGAENDISRFATQARRWAAEADLVLGAIGDARSVAIIGRERRQTTVELPPLRIEEIFRLAAVGSSQLSQSYERTNLLAGRAEGRDDWAPAYLSDELVDTEYGSLLGITDQMLKSWSMNGRVRYERFPYPDPPNWGFPKPLFDLVKETMKSNELTFNWNTTGVGYVIPRDAYRVVAFYRSGALPVSYIPGSIENAKLEEGDRKSVSEFEETGYKFFAGVGDPYLARVVQYASLYQIFREFGVHAAKPAATRTNDGYKGLAAVFLAGIKTLLKASSADLEKTVEPIVASQDEELRPIVRMLVVARLEELQEALTAAVRDYEPEFLTSLAWDIAQPRRNEAILARLQKCQEAINAAGDDATLESALSDPGDRRLWRRYMLANELSDVIRMFISVDCATAQKLFETAAAKRESDGWIRTSSMVVSSDVGDAELVGGHSLSSKIIEVRVSTDAARGAPRVAVVDGKRVLLVHPDDVVDAGRLVRTAARAADEASATRDVTSALGELRARNGEWKARTFSDALYGGQTPIGRGLSVREGDMVGYVRSEFAAKPDDLGRLEGLSSGGPGAFVIRADGQKSFVALDGHPNGALRAESMSDLAAEIAEQIELSSGGSRAVRVADVTGLTEADANSLRANVELELGRRDFLSVRGEAARIRGFLSSRPVPERFDFSKAAVSVERVEATRAGEAPHLLIAVQAPAKEAEKPSLIMRFRLFLKSIGKGTAAMVQDIVRRAAKAFGVRANGAFVRDALDRIRAELEQAHIDYESIDAELEGVLVASLREGRGDVDHPTRGRQAA